MLEILIFAIVMMYSPGPINMLSMFAGVANYGWQALRFCLGVGVAMCMLFVVVGWLGSAIITPKLQGIVAILGGSYIAYLAYKLMIASFQKGINEVNVQEMGFMSGLIMQLTNPKALVVVVPIVTVQFPNAHIEGGYVWGMSMLLGALAVGAPATYLFAGAQLKQAALNPSVMSWLQRVIAGMLLLLVGQFFIEGVKLLTR